MYQQQIPVQQPILFQPPVEVVDLGDSEEETGPVNADLEASIKETSNEVIAEPTSKDEATDEKMIEELKKRGYNVSKPVDEDTFLMSDVQITNVTSGAIPSPIMDDIQITDVTTIAIPSPNSFTNDNDPLEFSDEPQMDNSSPLYSPPVTPVSPAELNTRKVENAAPKSKPPAPSTLYSFMQHANNPPAARKTHHHHRQSAPTPSPQKNRSVSFSSETSASSKPVEDDVLYTSPLANIYAEPMPVQKNKISPTEYLQRRRQGGTSSYQNVDPPKQQPPDLVQDYINKRCSNGNVQAPAASSLKTSTPVKMKAPVKTPIKGILKPAEVQQPQEKRSHTHTSSSSSPGNSSKHTASAATHKKVHEPDIFPVGQRTPLPPKKTSPSTSSKRPEILVRHDKEYYFQVNNEDKTRCTLCKSSYKHITRHFKDKHSEFEVRNIFDVFHNL